MKKTKRGLFMKHRVCTRSLSPDVRRTISHVLLHVMLFVPNRIKTRFAVAVWLAEIHYFFLVLKGDKRNGISKYTSGYKVRGAHVTGVIYKVLTRSSKHRAGSNRPIGTPPRTQM